MPTSTYIRLFSLFALAAFTAVAVSAEVYKWKDEHGRVQFGDRPPSGATSSKIEIRGEKEEQAGEETESPKAEKVENVVMYSTASCTVCRQARAYMIAKGIAFTEYDVEKSATGRAAYKKMDGLEVPIITVGDQRMIGFNAAKLEQLIATAGVSGKAKTAEGSNSSQEKGAAPAEKSAPPKAVRVPPRD